MTISANYPTVAPSLNLDFANSQQLDTRINFTRAGPATYYDGETSVLAEQNLITYSQTIGGTGWAGSGYSVDLNNVVAPDGTTTASFLKETAVNTNHDVYPTQPSSIIGQTYTYSCYMKAGTRTWGLIRVFSAAGGGDKFAWFNLSTGDRGTVQSPLTATMNSMGSAGGGGWYRCTVTFTAAVATVNAMSVGLSTGNGVSTYLGDTSIAYGIYVWGAQFEIRSFAGVYTPILTTTTITNYNAQLLTAPLNTPRFDFNPLTRQSLGLLMEQSITNLVTYSSDCTNAAWTKVSCSITPTYTISPSGALDAQLITSSAGDGGPFSANIAVTNNVAYTFSCFAKANTSDTIKITWTGIAGGNTFTFSTASWGTGGGWTNTAQSLGNGWFRLSATRTYTGATGSVQGIALQIPTSGQSVIVWGSQIEALPFASSYIAVPAGSTVTRAQDLASITGTNFSSWFNNQQGTIYCNFDVATIIGQSVPWGIDPGNTNCYAHYKIAATLNNLNPAGGSSIGNVTANTTQQATYNYNNIVPIINSGSLNGATVVNSSPAAAPSFLPTQLSLGANRTNVEALTGHIRKFAYYPISLTSAQMQSITGS